MILIATWGASCTMGAIVGAVVDVPHRYCEFRLHVALYLSTLFSGCRAATLSRRFRARCSVAVCKFLGLTNIAVPASVVVGIAIALACDAVLDGRGARDAR